MKRVAVEDFVSEVVNGLEDSLHERIDEVALEVNSVVETVNLQQTTIEGVLDSIALLHEEIEKLRKKVKRVR